ncbi:type II toxin-antitoxin system RelE/ParE family toxin [Alsobacter sp. SYSU M60028]|uniref:Type II toxin-antitoxin system RelE/ParE family toxin n=1 Tax=Alsobacter ponti TaxID=2962936 RepID=A0ABT1L7T1_9HYPH|nr:type II toxin-antitoxin system RelE/ParE family toxin [Alsobacter ponti]MCP8937544.1 type II toxin-antitoxin system RelE/ParE family toxin [Alsobacter ponti]
MPTFATKHCFRLIRKAGINPEDLLDAARRAREGNIDARLGAFLVKQRVARQGQGKATGARAIMYFRDGDDIVFLHVFPKNEQATITRHERDAYNDFTKLLAGLSPRKKEAARTEWIKIE